MAVLIVDDETSTREALRAVLSQLGHKMILEARNGEDALKVLETEKAKIRIIIADWEMPRMDGVTLSDRLVEKAELDQTAFLLITSDLSPARLEEIRATHPRIDDSIVKPFRAKILTAAMSRAYERRARRRDAILWLSARDPDASLVAAMGQKPEGMHFSRITRDSVDAGLGLVVVDLSTWEGAILQASQSLKKDRASASLQWLGWGDAPERILAARTLCQQFLQAGGESAWCGALESISSRICHGLDIELLREKLKACMQRKDTPKAQSVVTELLALDPMNPDLFGFAADLAIQVGAAARAMQFELEALRLNPTLPKANIKLLELLSRSDREAIRKAAEQAVMFCPQSREVLEAVARALAEAGLGEDALAVRVRIEKLST